MLKKLRILGLALLALTGCNTENDASDISLFVTPSTLTAECGEKIYFDIEVRTIHDYIADLTIDTFDALHGENRVFTSQPGSATYSYRFVYTVPNFDSEGRTIQMRFTARDNLSNSQSRTLEIEIRNGTTLLPEYSGITLYSPHSGKPDGFSLTTMQPILCATSSPEEIDLYLEADANAPAEDLPTMWRTRTDVRFSRANNYDYAAATQMTLTAVYRSSVLENYVRDLAIDDIILIGRLDQAWGVAKIVGIFDEAGSQNDRYLINIKRINPETEEIPGDGETPEETPTTPGEDPDAEPEP